MLSSKGKSGRVSTYNRKVRGCQLPITRCLISVKGIVQGVGFRPFVYGLAKLYSLRGSVRNNTRGVDIDVEGEQESVNKFVDELKRKAPPLAQIEEINIQEAEPVSCPEFTIEVSERGGNRDLPVAVDVAVCDDCLRELFDPGDRRFRYPFINCTNCGPRFTIIKDVPYDRELTTMKAFPMCPNCVDEYHDPENRRFHAQPNACAVCGPRVFLRDSSGGLIDEDRPILKAAELLRENNIIAVKGLGGYHLACNALSKEAVSGLRERKVREDKPFAVMVRDCSDAGLYCQVSEEEKLLLESPARPIVLLRKKNNLLAEETAPGNAFLGLMLPYTPLHYLLFEHIDFPLVMTSGNLSDEPIAYEDKDAFLRLGEIAEYFLTHNRVISHRCDDSVTRIYRQKEYPIRRSRGYAPAPVRIQNKMEPVLAVGGEQKNTFCLTRGSYAFVSHHIGDLENLETLRAFEKEIQLYKRLFNIEPEIVAYDLHPEYLSTKYALELRGVNTTGVQHHHAHTASCMAEHGLQGQVIGVCFDGTGFGPDGSIWGGEFLLASFTEFKRIGHLRYVPMPGSARAVREPWRMAAGYLHSQLGADWRVVPGIRFLKEKNGMLLDALGDMMDKWLNCPPTSSMGRLFDAVAALLGIRHQVNYEGQAAVEMEQLAVQYMYNIKKIMKTSKTGPDIPGYALAYEDKAGTWEIDTRNLIRDIIKELSGEIPAGEIAYRFHLTVRDMVIGMCRRAREVYGENRVTLSGGVFQNLLLLDMVHRGLEENGFDVFIHRIVPANDGGISLGQAVIASERRKSGCV